MPKSEKYRLVGQSVYSSFWKEGGFVLLGGVCGVDGHLGIAEISYVFEKKASLSASSFFFLLLPFLARIFT